LRTCICPTYQISTPSSSEHDGRGGGSPGSVAITQPAGRESRDQQRRSFLLLVLLVHPIVDVIVLVFVVARRPPGFLLDDAHGRQRYPITNGAQHPKLYVACTFGSSLPSFVFMILPLYTGS
jgi:hypothetical protein